MRAGCGGRIANDTLRVTSRASLAGVANRPVTHLSCRSGILSGDRGILKPTRHTPLAWLEIGKG